jgi:outer membrane autotransporter protein
MRAFFDYRSISMKRQILPRSKIFSSVQAALVMTFVATPLIALGDDVTDSNASDNTESSYTLNNSTQNVFGNGKYFDLTSKSVIIGDTDGSENTVTLSTGIGQHVIGELRDESGNPAAEWAEGNIITLTGGSYGDVAGGLGTGQAGAGRLVGDVVNTGGNVVNISGTATLSGAVFGGFAAGNGDAGNNTVNLVGGTFTSSEEIYGGYATGGRADGNTVTINASSTFSSIEAIIGGQAKTGAQGNRVTITNGTFSGSSQFDILGAQVSNGSATENHMVIEGGSFSGGGFDIGGGYTTGGNATGNSVTITGGTFTDINASDDRNLDFVGGTAKNGSATGNTVDISGGTFTSSGSDKISILGGIAESGNATGNAVTLTDVAVSGANNVKVYGGRLDGDGTASSNSAILNGSTVVGEVLGAAIFGNGDATGNAATLNGAAEARNVYGAAIDGSGDASHNTVNLENTAEIDTGGKVVGGHVGGSGDATHNTVNVSENVNLASNVTLAGGAVGGTGDAFTGNTLNLKGWTGSVGSVNNFATYNVQVPQNLAAGAPIVTLTDSASGSSNLEGSEIKLFTRDGAPLADGSDVVVFSGAVGALNLGSGLANGGQSQGQHGIFLLYGLQTALDGGGNLKTSVTGVRVNPQTKALSEGFLSGVAFVNHAADLAAGQGLSDLRARTGGAGGSATGLVGFGTISYTDSRYETGSHVDVKGYNFLAGLGSSARFPAGTLALGGFFETGEGDYDTSNRFAGYANVKGDGDTRYYGGGVLGRFDFENGLYAEGSLRAGRLKNDFSSDIVDPVGIRAKYDTRGRYVSTHLGLGYGWALNPGARAEVYGKYLWTRQAGDSVTLPTGDPVKFSAVDSQRLRLGGRVTWTLSSQTDVFAGAAWEHEFDADARARVYGYRISAPSLEGDSGMGEIGIVMRPTANSPISLQATLQGYGGDRKGVAGGFNLKYAF